MYQRSLYAFYFLHNASFCHRGAEPSRLDLCQQPLLRLSREGGTFFECTLVKEMMPRVWSRNDILFGRMADFSTSGKRINTSKEASKDIHNIFHDHVEILPNWPDLQVVSTNGFSWVVFLIPTSLIKKYWGIFCNRLHLSVCLSVRPSIRHATSS